AARDAADAVASLARFGDEAKVLAGGQSLVPMLALRLARPAALVDINGCRDLEGLEESAGPLTLGGLAPQRELHRWARPPPPPPACGPARARGAPPPPGSRAPPGPTPAPPPPPRNRPRCSCASVEA